MDNAIYVVEFVDDFELRSMFYESIDDNIEDEDIDEFGCFTPFTFVNDDDDLSTIFEEDPSLEDGDADSEGSCDVEVEEYDRGLENDEY